MPNLRRGVFFVSILYIMKQKSRLKTIHDEYVIKRWTLTVRYTTTSSVCSGKDIVDGSNEACNQDVTMLEVWMLRGDLNKLYEDQIKLVIKM